jgi:cysteine desulfurase
LQAARETLAVTLGCDPLDLVWTSGATESNNMVLHHFFREAAGGGEVWVSAIEHPCVLAAARHYFPKRHRLIPVTRGGAVDIDWLDRALKKKSPVMIAVMAANNETGVVQPWRDVLKLCRRHRVPLFCDAAQWLGKLPARGLGDCDFVSGCAHKFGGPKGVGLLKCPSRGRAQPLLLGGPQEDGRRAGTENVAGVLAMMAALEHRERLLSNEGQKQRTLWRTGFELDLVKHLPGAHVVGAGQERLWNTVSALMPEADCQQRWVVKLDKSGFAVSTGSACSSGKEESSHVLAAMGYTPAEAASVLRFSSGWETTQTDWNSLLDSVKSVHAGRQAH